MTDPDQYDRFTYEECAQKHDGKCIDCNYGWKEKDGKEVSEIQALRYDKEIWTEGSARAHCKHRGGTFEPAKKEEDELMEEFMAFSHNSTVDDNEPDWASIDKTKLPRIAFARQGDPDKKSTWGFPHHWVKGGKEIDEDGIYTDGTLYLHRQGLGAAWAAANGARGGEKAEQAVLNHLDSHRKAIGMGEEHEKKSSGGISSGLMRYRNSRNAEATARFWGKSLDNPDWYKIEAMSEDETEVMIYDAIGWPFNDASEFVRLFSSITTPKILVRINSPGGDVFDSMAIFNAVQSHQSTVTTRIEALAASSASFIALAGKKVQAYQNAMMMIHNPWVHVIGNQYDLREVADILEKISGNMVDIYAANSHVGKREIVQMLKNVTWMTASEMKEKGFIDTILTSGKAAKAQFDLSMYANAPDGFRGKIGDDPEANKRMIEKALRDVGFSQNSAKAFIARGLKVESATEEEIAACQKILTTLGGK